MMGHSHVCLYGKTNKYSYQNKSKVLGTCLNGVLYLSVEENVTGGWKMSGEHSLDSFFS